MGPFCCPDLSVTRQARPAGASCAAFDPLFLYQAARLLLFSYPRAAFVRIYLLLLPIPLHPPPRTTQWRLAAPLSAARARGCGAARTCARPRSTAPIIIAPVDTARRLFESEWRTRGELLPKKIIAAANNIDNFPGAACTAQRRPPVRHAPRALRAALYTLVRCCAAPCRSALSFFGDPCPF